ncbi:MAG TPA: lipid-A-disaccharide synthase [Gammaproteobacteria bacterium]|nr:lipid-A-disaccharide synthase [Gammaproteobacteria bacterium]
MTSDSNNKTIFISAGEASGDAHAARMIDELKILDRQLTFVGMGGDRMREAGAQILTDIDKMAVVGLVEVLLKYRSLKAELTRLQNYIAESPPALLILVDYQEFNQRLAAFARRHGVRVLFYIGPQIWAWRPKRIYRMAEIVDHMAVILPFEKSLYEAADIAVTFTGHPLTDEVTVDKTRQQARSQLQISDQTTLGLFPGSRSGEIKRILPVLLETACLLREEKPDIQFILPVASTIKQQDLAPFSEMIKDLSVTVTKAPFYDVIQACDIILSASGTAVLEIGLLEVPMVIVMKVAAISHFILSKIVSIKYLGLVNIIAGKEIVKEFIQKKAKPHDIATEALRLLNDKKYYTEMKHELSLIRQQLGTGNGSRNIARLAYDMINDKQCTEKTAE